MLRFNRLVNGSSEENDDALPVINYVKEIRLKCFGALKYFSVIRMQTPKATMARYVR